MKSACNDRAAQMPLLALAVLGAVIAFALAACGSDDSGDEGPDADGVTRGEVPRDGGDSSASETAPGPEALASLPELARADSRDEVPAIRGSAGLAVPDWLTTVVNDVATFWQQEFNAGGFEFATVNYSVFDRGRQKTACGQPATPKTGPFYCPADQTIFLSVPYFEGFYGRFGDTAMAIPIAHEIGHHVENQLGMLGNPRYRTIDLELAADCLAGVWAHSVLQRDLLEEGDLEEAQASRIAVADPEGTSVDDPQAHGTKEERVKFFRRGYDTGRADVCV